MGSGAMTNLPILLAALVIGWLLGVWTVFTVASAMGGAERG